MSRIRVENIQASGVDVDHPSLREAVKNAVRRKVEKDYLVKITGMPYEVVDRLVREEREKQRR